MTVVSEGLLQVGYRPREDQWSIDMVEAQRDQNQDIEQDGEPVRPFSEYRVEDRAWPEFLARIRGKLWVMAIELRIPTEQRGRSIVCHTTKCVVT